MLHFLIGCAIIVGMCSMLANEGTRYVVGQLLKAALGLCTMAVCIAILAILFINLHH